MRITCIFIFCFLIIPNHSWSQLFPEDNAVLNYRIIGFMFTAVKNADEYKLELCKGDYAGKDFDKHISIKLKGKTNRIIGKVPVFKQTYSWRVTALKHSKIAETGKIHHFSTGTTTYLDTAMVRMKLYHQAEKYKDGYVFADATRILYDMSGDPVWYLPRIEGVNTDSVDVRDLKLTCKGTITVLIDGEVYETDYNGKVLWKGPNGRKVKKDSLQGYHHEITRLTTGHYLTLAFDPVPRRPVPVNRDSIMRLRQADTSKHRNSRIILRKPRYGNLIEYDDKENIVWKWDAYKYFENTDLSEYPETAQNDVHENSFYFDEKDSTIYLSFRNISQILKISYPSGKVLKAYCGNSPSPADSGHNLFCGQHAIRYSEHGYLYLFDNGCNSSEAPKVIKLKETGGESVTLMETWEFPCPVSTGTINFNRLKQPATTGGNVIELPDQTMFISTCSPYSNIYMVSQSKKILWQASLEKLNKTTNKWQPMNLYRASIIADPTQLDALIWNSINK